VQVQVTLFAGADRVIFSYFNRYLRTTMMASEAIESPLNAVSYSNKEIIPTPIPAPLQRKISPRP